MTKAAKAKPAIDSDEADFLAAVEEGLADAKAGRSVPYEKVRRWLLSWGTDKELPPPKCP
jgi:predicted transcriptional regulator